VSKNTRVAIGDVRLGLAAFGTPTSQSARRFDEIAGRFSTFLLNGFDVEHIEDVNAEHEELFVKAKVAGEVPALATQHLRRSTLRLIFRIARMEFGCEGDPTVDLALPPRSSLSARALTEEEVVIGRSYSLHTLAATRQPAAWALGEATATTGELPYITVDDLDLECADGPRVWLHGSRKRVARWGFLDDWGAAQLERRATRVKTGHLIYMAGGGEESAQRSCCKAINDTLVRAGLAGESDVRPSSLLAWAGVVALEETGTSDGVARRLGTRSLDAAARFIDFQWVE
jgi:hypothetical protein